MEEKNECYPGETGVDRQTADSRGTPGALWTRGSSSDREMYAAVYRRPRHEWSSTSSQDGKGDNWEHRRWIKLWNCGSC